MNRMAGHLDEILPDATLAVLPEEAQWPMIQRYLGIDPILQALYKQYCDARERLSQLTAEFGSTDAMTSVAADLKDSAASAIETRLLELEGQYGGATERSVASRPASMRVKTPSSAKQAEAGALDGMISFLIWAKLTLAQAKAAPPAVKRQFALAA